MSEPEFVTPSAFAAIPKNAEHFEAAQTATNRERKAYVATLSPEEQARFAAIEAAVGVLEQAKVPFFMWAFPEMGGKRGNTWQWCKESYHETYSPEAMKDLQLYGWAYYKAVLSSIVDKVPLIVALYDRKTKALVGLWGDEEQR